jgi:uncharacterized membrane protein YphA (DoxX/SURF4 family)
MLDTLTAKLATVAQIPAQWIRTAVAIYFLAICVGLLPGAGIEGLTGLFLSPDSAALLSGICVAILAIMLLAGTATLPAAAILSGLVLVSGVLLVGSTGYPDGAAAFLRDLALIGALMIACFKDQQQAKAAPVSLFQTPSRIHGVVGEIVRAPIASGLETEVPEVAKNTPADWRSIRQVKAFLEADGLEEIDNIFIVPA